MQFDTTAFIGVDRLSNAVETSETRAMGRPASAIAVNVSAVSFGRLPALKASDDEAV